MCPLFLKYATVVLVKYLKSRINFGHPKTCCEILHVIPQNYFGIYLNGFYRKLCTMLAIHYLCLSPSLLLRFITVLITKKPVEYYKQKTVICYKLVAPLHSVPLITYIPADGGGTRWRSWLRHCATSRKVAGSFPDGPHYGLGIDSASNRNEYQEYFLGPKAAGA